MEVLRVGTLGELLGKAGVIAVFGVLATWKAMAIGSVLAAWDTTAGADKYLDLAAQIAGLAFLLLILATTLFRFKPKATAEGWEPRLSALLGTFLTLSLVAFPPADLGPAWRVTAIALILVGGSLSIFVLARLGRSFSIVPQSRRLVTTGPYSIVRHPLYVCEEIAVIGVAMMCISPLVVLIVAVQWMFQLRRMSNEERVLRASFPEYAAYAARTPKVIPRLFRRMPSDRLRTTA
jgi:protein-S-isoprenylcysteine O-methyltransferase Ste14